MKMLMMPLVGALVLFVAGCRTQPADLAELNGQFTYHGQPVNPRAVEDLTTWISDEHPGPVAVDMAGTWDSNRYYGEVWQRDGMVGYTRPEPDSVFGECMFAYRYIGRLNNGAHVLKIVSNGGGTGYFESILLVKFVNDSVFDADGRSNERICIKQVGEYPLGDRVNAQVSVNDNALVWKTQESGQRTIRF